MSSIPSWARPGVKVVCVDDGDVGSERGVWGPGEAIVRGHVYTIYRTWIDFEGCQVCDLVEVKRSEGARRMWGPLVGYGLHRFRPVVPQRTEAEDLAHFRHHLTVSTPEAVDA